MRIAVLDTYYPVFLAAHYRDRPRLAEASYVEQLHSLLGRFFGTQDAYAKNLRDLGHDAINLITNCEPLQFAWAREQGSTRFLRTALQATPASRVRQGVEALFWYRVLEAQIAAFDPDVVFVHDLWSVRPRQLDGWRSAGRLVVGQIASPAPGPDRLRSFDLILTSFPHFVERFRALGIDSLYFKLGFDERVADALSVSTDPGSERPTAVVFVGGVSPRVHGEGTALLSEICRELDVDVYGYGAEDLPSASPILRRYHGPAWGLEMYEVLARARIAINRHIDVAEGHANNMRLYESTGVGTLLMTEDFENLADHFEPGEEVVTYASAGELVEKVAHYLELENERKRVAAAGQARTLQVHTYRRRMEELVSFLEPRLRR